MRLVLVANHASVHTRRWAAFFAQRGHDVHVVTCGRSASLEGDYAVHDLGPPWPGRLGYTFKVPSARRRIRALRPDVVHAHYATSYGALALAAGRRPLVVTAHGDDVLIAPTSRVLGPLVRRVLRAADLITVPGEHMRAAVERLVGTSAAPILVFQYGVDADALAKLAQEARAEPQPSAPLAPLRIVSVRPLLACYRLDLLLAALGRLAAEAVPFVCDVAGDGPERDRLHQATTELGISGSVRFRGQLDAAGVYALLARADVYVSVAESDGASLGLLEALALGAIPVLSDIDANRAWIDFGATGLLVSARARDIAEGIRRAAELAGARARRHNLEVVRERADLATNLGACEAALARLADPRARAASRVAEVLP